MSQAQPVQSPPGPAHTRRIGDYEYCCCLQPLKITIYNNNYNYNYNTSIAFKHISTIAPADPSPIHPLSITTNACIIPPTVERPRAHHRPVNCPSTQSHVPSRPVPQAQSTTTTGPKQRQLHCRTCRSRKENRPSTKAVPDILEKCLQDTVSNTTSCSGRIHCLRLIYKTELP